MDDISTFEYKDNLKQAILNIILNSRDALASFAAKDKKVEIELQKKSGGATILIRDNGGNISFRSSNGWSEVYIRLLLHGA